MPKIAKSSNKSSKKRDIESQKAKLKLKMFKSSRTTYFITISCLIISFIFNGNILANETGWGSSSSTAISVLDIIIRSLSVILFFFFGMISVANWQELRGYVMTWKEMAVLLILSLIQTTIKGNVFLISLIGISLVLTYLYFVQGKIEEEIEYD